MLGRALGGTLGLGHDEAAGAEAQVHELDDVGLGLEQRVLAADAAIGRARFHEHRGVRGPHDDVVDTGVADDERAARVVEAGHVQAGARERLDGVGVERALRHGDAQRALGRRLLSGRGLHGLFQVEREARGRAVGAVGCEQLVVAAAAADGAAEAGRKRLEHDARVVVERAHDREVHDDAVRQAAARDELERLLERVERIGATERSHELARLAHRLAAASDAGQRADNRRELRAFRLRAVAELVDRHEVGLVERLEQLGLPRLGGARRGQQRAEHAHGCERQLEVGHARHLERLGEEADDLGVGFHARGVDAFDADLLLLAHVGAQLAFGLAEDALHVAEAERPARVAQARRAHARHLQRHVGAHGDEVARGVEELERRGRHAPARLHDGHALERGRLDGHVAPAREQVGDAPRDALARHGLVGQHVAEPRWCRVFHSLLPHIVVPPSAADALSAPLRVVPLSRRALGERPYKQSFNARFVRVETLAQ